MNALTSTRSPTVIVPSTTPTVARHMISVTAMAMIALCVDVEQRQRRLARDRRVLPALQALVVAARLPLLVAEVLDRLVVEQAVDRARVRLRVELVHLAAGTRAPVGDRDRREDVERQRGERDRDERPVVAGDQDRRDEADLDQRGQDREQREADQRGDAALAALDVAREPARLPREMEAQRQRVQVAEHLERDRAHRALRHLCEQVFAKLGEERRRQPQHAVGDEQREGHRERSPNAGSRLSTICFSSSGTPTLATLAPISAASAASTRPLYAHR